MNRQMTHVFSSVVHVFFVYVAIAVAVVVSVAFDQNN